MVTASAAVHEPPLTPRGIYGRGMAALRVQLQATHRRFPLRPVRPRLTAEVPPDNQVAPLVKHRFTRKFVTLLMTEHCVKANGVALQHGLAGGHSA